MLKLLALSLIAFSLTFASLGLVQYFRTRQRAALLWSVIGVAALGALFFLASGAAVQLFGALPIGLDLRALATGELVGLAVGALAAGGAAAIFVLGRTRRKLALGIGIGAAVSLLLLLWGATMMRAVAPAPTTANKHPGMAEIVTPEGFRIREFATGLQEPNALAFDDAGNLYYSELVDGNIVRLRDTNGDGSAEERTVFASGFKNPRGLAWRDGTLYVASRGQINTLRDTNGDRVADENKVIMDGLFSLDIQHSNNGIAFGPDGKLYIAIGGPRVGQLTLENHEYSYQGQPRDDWFFAGVIQADADGKNPKLFARGLRNPYALAFGSDGKLFATDNGDETIPAPDGDELNLVEPGRDYGYPYFFGYPPPWSDTAAPIVRFVPHTAPTGVTVYDAEKFPAEYRGNIFTALYWRGQPGSRMQYREVARVAPEQKEGETVYTVKPFLGGLDRPIAVTVGPDGALYIADMRGGKADPEAPGTIYKLEYVGK